MQSLVKTPKQDLNSKIASYVRIAKLQVIDQVLLIDCNTAAYSATSSVATYLRRATLHNRFCAGR